MSEIDDQIPATWHWESLANVVADGAPILYGILQPGPNLAEGIPYVRPTEIVADVIDMSSIRRTSATIAGKYRRSMLKADDILLSIVGTIGKVAIVPVDLDGGNITQSSVRIRPRSEVVLPRFIAWLLRSPMLRKQFDKHRLGTAVPRLNVAHVRALRVPIPPLQEQWRIVAAIEKQVTLLEAGIKALRKVQANLKRFRVAVLTTACEGHLVPTEFDLSQVGHQDTSFESGKQLLARILKERRNNWRGRGKDKEPAPLGVRHLPSLPDGWTWATVDQLGRIETGNTPPKDQIAYYGDDVPLIKPGELLDHPVVQAADNLTLQGAAVATVAPPDSVLVSCIGNLGKTAITTREAAFNQQINAIIPTLTETARWIFYAVQQREFRQQLESVASATTISIVNKSKFSMLHIPLPPLPEQARIVAEIERQLSLGEELESLVTANLQRATNLRQSILQKAFTGELTSEDPNDKYMKKLMVRIKHQSIPVPELPEIPWMKGLEEMPSRSIASLSELLERLDKLGGSAGPEQLLLASGLGDDIETFFDLLRAGRNDGSISIPAGESGDINRTRNAN